MSTNIESEEFEELSRREKVLGGISNATKAFSSLSESYTYFRYDAYNYIVKFLLPLNILGLFVVFWSIQNLNESLNVSIVSIVTISTIIFAVFYPQVIYTRYRNKLNNEFPLFIIHLTALSLSNTERVEMFKRLSQSDEYEAISKEINLFVSHIETFNASLDEAAKLRANETPSQLMADFYEKLAYSVGAGQDLSDFLTEVQEDIRDDYANNYDVRVKRIEYLTSMAVGGNISAAYLFVLFLVIPLIVGLNPVLLLSLGIIAYIFLQIAFVMVINSVAPKDYLWYWSDEITTRTQRLIKLTTRLGIVASLIIGGFLVYYQPSITRFSYPIIATIPLLIPSLIIYRAEKKINQSESQYSSFIKTLGNIENVKQTSTRNVLKSLKNKDFGTLDSYINSLYQQIYLSIDDEQAWDNFSANIGSRLVRSFSNMYYIGREMGANTKELGEIIGTNFKHLRGLRKNKTAVISKLRGNIYGVGIVSSLTYFLTTSVLEMIRNETTSIPSGQFASIINTEVYNFLYIDIIIFTFVIVNAVFIGLLVRISQRRYIGGFVIHVVIFIWVAFSIGYGVEQAFSQVLGG